MKKRFTLLLIMSLPIFKMNAQVVLYEGFNSGFNPTAAGWDVQNLSSAPGSNATGWFQGTPAQFDAITGAPNDYFASDINSTASAGTTNTISCWLITPTLNLVNGAIIQFATKGSRLPVAKADRLQVYYSLDAGTNVGTTAGSATNTAGTFTNIVMDLNPNLNATGYSSLWSTFTRTLTGIATPTVGRLAFRYYVPNGGAAGPNGNYIGIDEFRYQMPCQRPMHFGDVTTTACLGAPVTLSITNSTPTTAISSYTWFTGATTNSFTYTFSNAGLTEIWSVVESTPGCQNLDISFVTTFTPPVVSYSVNPQGPLCAGKGFTVSASGGTTYTYNLSSTSSSTSNPIGLLTQTTTNTNAHIQFTLTGRGTTNCRSTQVVTVALSPIPVVTVSLSKNTVCAKNTVSITAGGASTYSWSGSSTSTASAFNYTAGATAGVSQFTVYGVSQDGCRSADAVASLTVSLCTGIDETDLQNNVSFYPNPFNETLNVDFAGRLELYNQLGQLVLSREKNDNGTLNTSQLAPGIYVMKAYTDSGEKRARLVKN